MTEEVGNLILEHMKRFQASQNRMEQTLQEHTLRLGRLEITVAGLQSELHQGLAEQGVRIDRLTERIDRIERRLELTA